METENRRRRRLTAAATECSRGGAPRASVLAGVTTIHDLADELLELVFLRVRSHRCLVRAAAACRPWRRLIPADGFLRRFLSLHAPVVLGHFYAGGSTTFVPAPTLLVKDVAGGGGVRSRVSLGFLLGKVGGISDLFLSDCRGGLLAFTRSDCSVVVCDPWARQYRVLVSPMTMPGRQFCLGAFLLDTDDIGTVRVLCVCGRYNFDEQNGTTAQISVFLGTDEHWLLLARTVVENQFVSPVLDIGLSGSDRSKVCVGRVGGSLFWSVKGSHIFRVNETTGAFLSFCMLPKLAPEPDWYTCGDERRKFRVVGRDARAVRLVRIVDEDLQVLQLVDGGGMCVEEMRVNLSELCNTETAGPDRSWHFLELSEAMHPNFVELSQDDEKCTWMFYVDVESMKVERVQRWNWNKRSLFPYERPWTPTIKACLKTRRRRRSMSLGL